MCYSKGYLRKERLYYETFYFHTFNSISGRLPDTWRMRRIRHRVPQLRTPLPAPAQTETPALIPGDHERAESEETGPSPADESGSPADSAKELTAVTNPAMKPQLTCQAGIRIGSLKGPTSMGLVSLMDKASKGETSNVYEFTMAGKADELVGKIANGDLDIALLPANVASVLYTKTQGNITVLDINTLGVLYVVASDDSITSMADLRDAPFT